MSNNAPEAVDFAPYFTSAVRTEVGDEYMLQNAFELRFQVYCVECGFLAADQYPKGIESDAYDDDSAHFFAHNLRKELVGYVRLVPGDQRGEFPWQLYCRDVFDGVELPPAAEAGEISRLMVRHDYRRRRGDILSGVTARSDDEPENGERRGESPQILLRLYREMYQHSLKSGIRYWYAAMERPLARALQRMNFAFRQVGPETDYFGPVAPYLADLRELEANVEASQPELLAWMQMPDQSNS